MGEHLKYEKAAPGALRAMYSLQKYVEECGLEHSLLELVKTRASQINGCAYCIDMLTKEARAEGRNRTATLWAECVARDALLFRARACCTRVGRGRNPVSQITCPTRFTNVCASSSRKPS